jgi:hypothetical protein
VQSSYHPVKVLNFLSSLTVDSQHASLEISTRSLGGELRLSTSYSSVGLTLPPESSFRLQAKVRGGVVQSDFRQSDWQEQRSEELFELLGAAGGGGLPVTIETSYGDIRIQKAGSQ